MTKDTTPPRRIRWVIPVLICFAAAVAAGAAVTRTWNGPAVVSLLLVAVIIITVGLVRLNRKDPQ